MPYNRPKLCPNAEWNPNATTFAIATTVGTLPHDVFVDINNTVYVVAPSLNRIQVWSNGNTSSMRSISGDFNTSLAIFVSTTGDIYIDYGLKKQSVDKLSSNATKSTIAMYVAGRCFGLFIDINDNLYCSMDPFHQVSRRFLSDSINSSKIIAGTGIGGNKSDMLYGPRGIFVDTDSTLYVADSQNHRIQRFRLGKSKGSTVAGAGALNTTTLIYPTGVLLDADGFMFIVEWGGHRIVASGPNGFRCIAGCTHTNGSASYELLHPNGISFDHYGNIYVTDVNNDRVQKFLLISNACGKNFLFFFSLLMYYTDRRHFIIILLKNYFPEIRLRHTL